MEISQVWICNGQTGYKNSDPNIKWIEISMESGHMAMTAYVKVIFNSGSVVMIPANSASSIVTPTPKKDNN